MKPALLLATLALAACSTTGSSISSIPGDASGGGPRFTTTILGGAPSAKLSVALFDAPIAGVPGVKVNIGIDAVQLITPAGGTVPFVTNAKPSVVNLIDLWDHSYNFNGNAPTGTYAGVRLLIDSASSSVTLGKFSIPILWGTPGQVNTAPVIAVDFPCSFALTTLPVKGPQISLDFNVLHSVTFRNGAIYVQPTVAAANAAAQVRGEIENAAGKPVSTATVLALDALGHVVNSTITGSDGKFAIHALPAGIYTIQVKNSYVTAMGDTVTATNADAGASPSTTVVVSPNDDLELDLTD
jgi:Carboxypeptidase regulatory-like domain